jgi:hypothetical protein
MKRWFSKDSVKTRIGLALLTLIAVFGVLGSIHRPAQYNTVVKQSTAARTSTQDAVNISEKPKISLTETKIESTQEEIPFTTTQTYDGTLPKDTTVVRVEGSKGKKTVKTEVKTKDGVEIGRALISEEVTVPPVSKVVAVGTKVVAKTPAAAATVCDTHYTPCIKKVSRGLDCKDIGYQVRVVNKGDDPLGLDPNNDGVGCENYPEL